MTVIGMDVHQRYLTVALMDDDGSDPEEFRIDASRDELEEFAREHAGAEAPSRRPETTSSFMIASRITSMSPSLTHTRRA